MKITSKKLTAICMDRRDALKQQALSLRAEATRAFEVAQEQADQLIKAAKHAMHSAKIEANRLDKEADLIQEAINEELELTVKEEQTAVAAWEPKSEAHLKAEFDEWYQRTNITNLLD